MSMAFLLASAVTVAGTTSCPSAAEVSAVLAPLLASERTGEPHLAHLREKADGIEVELRSERGRSLANRTFSRESSCGELASAIAVVIATWEASLAGDAPEIRVAVPVQQRVPRKSGATLSLAGGLLVAVDGSGWSSGAIAAVEVGHPDAAWSARIAAIATTRKRDTLSNGEIAWARQALAVGPRYRIGAGRVAIALGAELALGLLVASGHGFSVDRTAFSFEPGTSGSVNASLALHDSINVFAETAATWWLRDGRLEVTGIPELATLPRNELRLMSGIEWRPNP
jgi:hypothetical protein